MPIEPGASWFSPKCVEAQRLCWNVGVKHCFTAGGESCTKARQTQNTTKTEQLVRRWGISFIVKRETAQTTS
jgi:hypothetical protein